MLQRSTKAHAHLRVRGHYLDDTLHNKGIVISLVAALIAALALLIAFVPISTLVRDWSGQSAATAAPSVQLSTPRVPLRPVEPLERTDLSVVVTNPSDRPLANISLELSVLQPDGSTAMVSRQSHIALQAHDSRAIYWQWRVPQLPSGLYGVQVRALDATGRPLGDQQPQTVGLQIVGRNP